MEKKEGDAEKNGGDEVNIPPWVSVNRKIHNDGPIGVCLVQNSDYILVIVLNQIRLRSVALVVMILLSVLDAEALRRVGTGFSIGSKG